jgi:glycosyltransferase involved in cell wall biosynthesis
LREDQNKKDKANSEKVRIMSKNKKKDRRYNINEWDWKRYLSDYPDLVESGMVTNQQAFKHFITHGVSEGRSLYKKGERPSYLRDDVLGGIYKLLVSTPEIKFESLPLINPSQLSIHWVMPDWDEGGGGHMTLFTIIHYLEKFGHKNTIWILNPTTNETADEAYDNIVKRYGITLSAQVRFLTEDLYSQTGNAIFATSWGTTYHVERCLGFNDRFYFVQDYEPYFYSRGSNAILAENSYRLGLSHVCAGTWLRQKMESNGSWARHFYLGVDKVYSIKDVKKSDVPLLAIYSRIGTQRRCVELILSALEILGMRGCKFKVAFYGGGSSIGSESYENEKHGILSSVQLCDLYNQATLGICFSGTNYSRVPVEMMSCGLPVVELDVESTRTEYPEGTVEFSGPLPVDIANKVESLLNDPVRQQEMAKKALEWIAPFTWESSARQVESAIFERLNV